MKKIQTLLLSLLFAATGFAANSVVSVSQVGQPVTVTEDVDYTITSAEPFSGMGTVSINNTEHAVVVIAKIKPSVVISTWLKNRVFINGEQAVNNKNCQVKMYGQGAIILPYANTIKPLTVFSEQNYGGTSVNDFGLENTGGFMNTLTEDKLNNKIRSFKLKRGYMVTFSTRAKGRGYSRCFIADKADLEVASLPAVLDQKISSYRVFHWYNAKKAGLASDTRVDANAAVNSSWCYDWGTGVDRLPDVECVPNHIYENWPSPEACGSVTYSCHMKTNNEPGNSADDHPQDVATVLANWENLMATGLRLCSESSHDGSMSHLKAFIDSIDARGWRCDILDLHCYWPQGTFNNLNWYSSNYGNGRPIWISEWVWGASWNNNGAFAVSNRNDYEGNWANNYNGTKPILDILNSNSKVERYAFWNSEANCSKIYLNGTLSTLGEYYATMGDGLGYNPDNEFIPKNPRQYAPTNLSVQYNKVTKKVTLKWHDYNGEYNQSMAIQVKTPSTGWTNVTTVTPKEGEDDYEAEVDGLDGYMYRIRVKDLNGKTCYTNEATAVNENVQSGDEVMLGETIMYLGGNKLLNGNFDLGLLGWENGEGKPLAAPYFQVMKKGGVKDSPYLQCYGGSTDVKHAQSIRRVFQLEEGKSYYVAGAGCNTDGNMQRMYSSSSENYEFTNRLKLPETSSWASECQTFTATGSDKVLLLQFRDFKGVAQVDEVIVAQLFPTREEAMADALVLAKERVQLAKQYMAANPLVAQELDQLVSEGKNALELEEAVATCIAETQIEKDVEARRNDATTMAAFNIPGAEKVTKALEVYDKAATIDSRLTAAKEYLKVIDELLTYSMNTSSISGPDFSVLTSWKTKTGTYTAGDQRANTVAGKKCWNAWWNISATGNEDKTMAVNQTVASLDHGFYALECKAATEHYCEVDQHAFISNATPNTTPLQSPYLSWGALDIPTFAEADRWATLVTPYVYVNDGESLNIGFEGSKKGATDKLFMTYGKPSAVGDNREGWWCATDFQLRYCPVYMLKPAASGFGVICLPRAFSVSSDVTIYEVAGILADGSKICLQPVTETVAGVPYLFTTEKLGGEYSEAVFVETGKAVTSAEDNSHGLRGVFKTRASQKYATGTVGFIDGAFKYVATTADKVHIENYSAYIYNPLNLTALTSWEGVAIPCSGIPADKLPQPTGIDELTASQLNSDAPAYTPAGIKASTSTRGIIIKQGKKAVVKKY